MPGTTQCQHNTEDLHQELNRTVENNSGSQLQIRRTGEYHRCGIYQGDALSLLLFCIGLNPLSQIITKSGYGYKLKSGATVRHLLYMDDIKLYAKNERDIDSLIHLTRVYSEDIRMSFGLEKCGRIIARRGKVIKTDGLELPAGHIADMQTSYKYLGIPQSNHDQEEKRTATSKYHQRVSQVLKSQLNEKNKI